MTQESRRRIIKGLAITLPATWATPVVESVILPAHAGTSECEVTTTRITGFVREATSFGGDFWFGGVYPLTGVSVASVGVFQPPSSYPNLLYDQGPITNVSRSALPSCGANPEETITPSTDANTRWAILTVNSDQGTVGILGGGDSAVTGGDPPAIDEGSIEIETCSCD